MPGDRAHTWKGDTVKKLGKVTDPYLSEEGLKTSKCKLCHLLYKKKRWFRGEGKEEVDSGVNFTVCPACQKIRDHYPGGYLILRTSEYLTKHGEEILHVINNEASRAEKKNPLQRIMEIKRDEYEWLITTTDEKLAQHLGREIHKAHAGEIEYRFGERNKIARVYWSRV